MSGEGFDYAAPVLGVREWQLHGGVLCSTVAGDAWLPGEGKKAQCNKWPITMSFYTEDRGPVYDLRVRHGHEAPVGGCGCGLYAYGDREACERYGAGLAHTPLGMRGVVSAWGDIECHEYGFRAHYMRLEALLAERDDHGFAYEKWPGEHQQVAEYYRVPLILPEELTSFAREKGMDFLEPDPEPPSLDSKERRVLFLGVLNLFLAALNLSTHFLLGSEWSIWNTLLPALLVTVAVEGGRKPLLKMMKMRRWS